jgi:hypothetical protein
MRRRHLAHPLQVRRKIERLRIERASPREREQLPGQAGATGDRAAHAVENASPLLRGGLLVVPLAVHHQQKVFPIGGLTGHGRVDERTDVGPDLRPDVIEPASQRARVLGAENLGVRVVIKEPERIPPCHEHRKL